MTDNDNDPDQPVEEPSKNDRDDTKSQFSEESKRYSTLKKWKKSAKIGENQTCEGEKSNRHIDTRRPSSKTEIRRVIKAIRG